MKDLTLTRSAGIALPEMFDTLAIRGPVRGLLQALRNWNQRRTTLRELESLSDRELDDIGLTRNEIGRVIEDMR